MIDYTKPAPGMKISVIGDGAWGTAIALTLLENGYRVMLWGAFPEYTSEMKKERMNYKFLPGIPLPESLEFTNSLEEAVKDARLLVMASPSQFMRDVSRKLGEAMKEPYPIVTVAKGIETDGIFLKRMSEIIEEETKCKHVSCLSGPSHAAQVARKMPAAVTVASKIPQLATFVQQIFSNEHLRVYTNSDIIGVELCGTLKNIIAIAAGAVDGMEFGTNTKSALVTRGLVEMMRFGVAMGAQVESFIGLAGIGDLMTTCNQGRNYTFGMNLVKGMSTGSFSSITAARVSHVSMRVPFICLWRNCRPPQTARQSGRKNESPLVSTNTIVSPWFFLTSGLNKETTCSENNSHDS